MAEGRLARYEMLLRVRERQEDLKAQALAIARNEHAALRRQRRELEERRRSLLKEADIPRGTRVEPARVQAIYQYQRHLGRRADAKDSEIAMHAQVVESARAELETAMGRKRMMEKLIERTEKAERAEALRREQRWHDESAVIRFAHRRRMSGEG